MFYLVRTRRAMGLEKNLKELGFFVYNKKGFAQKRSMTIASLSEINGEN